MDLTVSAPITDLIQNRASRASEVRAGATSEGAIDQLNAARLAGSKVAPVGRSLNELGASFLPSSLSYGAVRAVGAHSSLLTPTERRLDLTASNGSARVHGTLSVSPFLPQPEHLLVLAGDRPSLAIVRFGDLSQDGSSSQYFEPLEVHAEATVHADGTEAISAFRRVEQWERIGLIGVGLGVVDRSYAVVHEALGNPVSGSEALASNQSVLRSLAAIDAVRATVELVAHDLAGVVAARGVSDLWMNAAKAWITEAVVSAANAAEKVAGLVRPDLAEPARVMAARASLLSRTLYAQAAEREMAADQLARGALDL